MKYPSTGGITEQCLQKSWFILIVIIDSKLIVTQYSTRFTYYNIKGSVNVSAQTSLILDTDQRFLAGHSQI